MAGAHLFDHGDGFNSYPHLTVPVAYPPHRGSIGGLSPMSGVSPLSGISPMTKGEVNPRPQNAWGLQSDIIQLLTKHKHSSFPHRTVHLGALHFRAMDQPQLVIRRPGILRIPTGVGTQTLL